MRTDEKELQDKMAIFLAKYFYVEKEVWSTDGKCRIDIAMIHHSDKDRIYPIGIEIKTDDKKTGSCLGQWLHQANGYTLKEFINFGKLMVITYPQISGQCLDEGKLMHPHNVYEKGDLACQHNVNTFLGQFNLGELQKYKYKDVTYLRIVFNSRMVWDHRKDDFRVHNYIFGCKK
jgi:hypothetical protein